MPHGEPLPSNTLTRQLFKNTVYFTKCWQQ